MPKRYTPEEAKQLVLERGFSPLEPYHGAKSDGKPSIWIVTEPYS